MALTNGEKNKHGLSAEASLQKIIEELKANNYINDFTINYRAGIDEYKNKKQFYCPFLIEFADKKEWALFSTTSMRTDRIKGQQWDAINLKQINSAIDKVYLVYPNGLAYNETCSFEVQNGKYESHYEFSAIDAVISQKTLYKLAEAYAQKDFKLGTVKAQQGNNFEGRVANTLSYDSNFEKWKNNDTTIEGMYYDLFLQIVDKFHLPKDSVASISATSDKKIIGRLPSGGNPKTDVLVTVKYTNNETEYYTISCKRSSEDKVSVHQYTADAFADVLDKENDKLRRMLKLFQDCANLRDMGKENVDSLTECLAPYTKKLLMWVLGGFGGEQSNNYQCAKYIVTYDNSTDTASVHSTSEYCDLLCEQNITGNFGTPFSWTYPSKQRGKYIQLKIKIIK